MKRSTSRDGKNSDPKTPVPSGSGTRSAERAPRRENQRACGAAASELLVGVVDDVGVAVEQRARSGSLQRIGSQKSGSSAGRAGHGVHAGRRRRFVPRREHQDVVRQAAAHDLGHLGEHLPDVERLGHGVQQPPQAVDALAAEGLALRAAAARWPGPAGRRWRPSGAWSSRVKASSADEVSQMAPCTCAPWRIVQSICDRAFGIHRRRRAACRCRCGAPVTSTSPAGVAA